MTSLRLVVVGALAATALSGPVPAQAAIMSPSVDGTSEILRIDAPLRTLAEPHGLHIGTAVDLAAFADDATYRDWLFRDFSAVTAENVMKWESLEPSRGQYVWGPADRLVDAALSHGQRVHGHTLLWHNQLPTWLTDAVADGSIGDDELREIVRSHITTVVDHFKGRIWHWEVVNEAIADDNVNLRDSIFLRHLGPGYIADALRWANAADPLATLWLNDFAADRMNAKSDTYYELAKKLLEEGAPLHGVGFQGHVAQQSNFPITAVDNLRRFDALGLATGFTEVDVRYQLPGDSHKTAAQVAGFTTLLQACLLTPGCEMFTLWGFTDRYSWIPGWFTDPPEGEATPLDANYQPKPAYRALQQTLALAHRPSRR